MPDWVNRRIEEDRLKEEEKARESLRVFFENQTQQMAQLSHQISSLVTGYESMRTDFNAKWNELPRMYMPRQEDQARNLEGRITALEAYRISSTRETSDLRMTVQQDVQKSVAEIQKAMAEQKDGIDSRTMAAWATGFFLLANIVWSVIGHYILK